MNKLNKQNRDRLTDGEQDDSQWGGVRGGATEQKGKRTHGHDNNVLVAGVGG